MVPESVPGAWSQSQGYQPWSREPGVFPVLPDSVIPDSVIPHSVLPDSFLLIPVILDSSFFVIPDSVIPDSIIPLSTYTLYLIPESNFHVIHDSVIPFSVITLSTSMLYLILLYPIPLCLIPFLHYTQFCYTSFHLNVIPDS